MLLLLIIAIIALIFSLTMSSHLTSTNKLENLRNKYEPNSMERIILDTSDTELIKDTIQSNTILEKHAITGDRNELQSYIPNIIYINLDESNDRKQLIEQELTNLNNNLNVYRLSAIKRSNGAIGCFLSHIAALSHALKFNTNFLILEDDFQFKYEYQTIVKNLQNVESLLKNRWDCIVFGQYVHKWQPIDGNVFRILDCTTTSGYLVNKNYIQKLLTFFINEFRTMLGTKFNNLYHIDQCQRRVQSTDFWVGFLKSIGCQRPGKSIIGNTFASNSWEASEDLTYFIHGDNIKHPLETLSSFKRKKIAICNVATGKYSVYVKDIQHDMHKNFLKGHELGFFLFTDSNIPNTKTDDGDNLHVYHIEHKPWPYPTLYRYHYMLLGKKALLDYDYMLYVDVDYRVYDTVPESDIFVDGTFAVKHLHELTKDHKNVDQQLFGSPEVNSNSKAYIEPNSGMKAYVCGGCQGGKVADYLKACETIKSWINIDLSNNIMPIWHDESMWNRYCVTNPPAKLLSQSYIYPEECIRDGNEKICDLLKKHNIKPIMLPIKKDHKNMRNI